MPEIVNRQKSMKLSAAMTAMLEICLIVSVILSAVDTAEDEGAGYAFCRFIVDGKAPAAAGLDEDAAQVA